MRPLNIVKDYKGNETITWAELSFLRDSIKDSFNPNEQSTINKSLTKKQSFSILLNEDFFLHHHPESFVEHIHFINVIREFVLHVNRLDKRGVWKKKLKVAKVIKDAQDFRKEKLEKINQKSDEATDNIR